MINVKNTLCWRLRILPTLTLLIDLVKDDEEFHKDFGQLHLMSPGQRLQSQGALTSGRPVIKLLPINLQYVLRRKSNFQ